MVRTLKDALKQVETWPEEVQSELADIVLEIEAGLRGGTYRATAEELQAIDEADQSGIADADDVEAAFQTFRRA
jgi:hypothetical protein